MPLRRRITVALLPVAIAAFLSTTAAAQTHIRTQMFDRLAVQNRIAQGQMAVTSGIGSRTAGLQQQVHPAGKGLAIACKRLQFAGIGVVDVEMQGERAVVQEAAVLQARAKVKT